MSERWHELRKAVLIDILELFKNYAELVEKDWRWRGDIYDGNMGVVWEGKERCAICDVFENGKSDEYDNGKNDAYRDRACLISYYTDKSIWPTNNIKPTLITEMPQTTIEEINIRGQKY